MVANNEAFYNEVNTGLLGNGSLTGSTPNTAWAGFTGTLPAANSADGTTGSLTSPLANGSGVAWSNAYNTGTGMTTSAGENLGTDSGNVFPQMAFSIEKVSVIAETRALQASYTMELAQDLKAIHGLDAETELSNILSG